MKYECFFNLDLVRQNNVQICIIGCLQSSSSSNKATNGQTDVCNTITMKTFSLQCNLSHSGVSHCNVRRSFPKSISASEEASEHKSHNPLTLHWDKFSSLSCCKISFICHCVNQFVALLNLKATFAENLHILSCPN